jgi:hypothetical protein
LLQKTATPRAPFFRGERERERERGGESEGERERETHTVWCDIFLFMAQNLNNAKHIFCFKVYANA